MASTQRYWDGERWTEQTAPAQHMAAPAKSGPSVWVVAGGVLIAALVAWFVYAVVTANDDLDCAIQDGQSSDCG